MTDNTNKPYLRPKYQEKTWFQKNKTEFYIILLGFIGIHCFLFFNTFSGDELDSKTASEFGSFIGGYLGTLFALTSVVFLYATLKNQRKTSEIEKFENKFFELLSLHKNNVEEIILKNQNGKKIFVLFIREFREILRITTKIFKSVKSKTELINIAYLTFFYGTGPNSTRILKGYLTKYDPNEIEKFVIELNNSKKTVKKERNFNYTPFEGHQSRLGHYFRHLFQTISFVDKKDIDVDKYEYIKILRAQLSNHEQALLALNSISDLGKPWNDNNLIKKYRFIKNIPQYFFKKENEVDLKDYFKGLVFEYEEQQLVTKNIVHLAESTKNEDDSNK